MSEVIFGAFILSHGRSSMAHHLTYEQLRKSGYTGPVKVIIDNEDDSAEAYASLFGAENVIVFDKVAVSSTFDEGDNFEDRRAIIYARNACFDVARALGWTHFIQLDDDYTSFRYVFKSDATYASGPNRIYSLDTIFAIMVDLLRNCPDSVRTVAMCQGGDLLGGSQSGDTAQIDMGRKGKRKAMNTFVCQTDRPIGFVGRINEDVNTYVRKGSVGDLFFTINAVRVDQCQTQSNAGGMTELYRDSGTYVKSFYTVMYSPSSVRVHPLNMRWHHRINWRHTTPKILRENVKHGTPNCSNS